MVARAVTIHLKRCDSGKPAVRSSRRPGFLFALPVSFDSFHRIAIEVRSACTVLARLRDIARERTRLIPYQSLTKGE
jgi:hypothetical protein